MIRQIFSRSLAVLGMIVICLGATSASCGLNDIGRNDDNDDDDGDRPAFVADLTLLDLDGNSTDSFDRGETIRMQFTVRNRLDTSADVDFTDARTSDFVVVRENSSSVVWKWSADRNFAQTPTTLSFAPGETKTFTVDWEQLDNDGDRVRSDTYEARGVLVYSGFDSNPLRSNQTASTLKRFTIR